MASEAPLAVVAAVVKAARVAEVGAAYEAEVGTVHIVGGRATCSRHSLCQDHNRCNQTPRHCRRSCRHQQIHKNCYIRSLAEGVTAEAKADAGGGDEAAVAAVAAVALMVATVGSAYRSIRHLRPE